MPGTSPLDMMGAPQQRARRPRAPPARRRRRLAAALAIVAGVALAWVALWYYAASVADRTLAGWVQREAAADRVYSCGAQSIGGFPLRIKARCTAAAAEINDRQPPYAVKARSVTFAADVWRPTRLIGDVEGPLTLAVPGQPPSWIADWAQARLIVRGVPPDPEAISIRLDGSQIDRAGNAEAATTVFKAERAELSARIIDGSAGDRPVIELTLHLAAASAPTLHPLLRAPLGADIDAVLRGLKDLSPKPWAARVRDIQASAGGIEVKSLRIVQGDVIVAGAGTLSVNAHGKLDGLVRVAIAGVDHLVPFLGIDRLIGQGIDRLSGTNEAAQGFEALDRLVPGLGNAVRDSASASLVDNLKRMGQPTTIDDRPAVALPLRFVDGSVYLGMVRVGEVPPLL